MFTVQLYRKPMELLSANRAYRLWTSAIVFAIVSTATPLVLCEMRVFRYCLCDIKMSHNASTSEWLTVKTSTASRGRHMNVTYKR